MIHEVAHIWMRDLDVDDLNLVARWYKETYGVDIEWNDIGKFWVAKDNPNKTMVADWEPGRPELSVNEHLQEALARGYQLFVREGTTSASPTVRSMTSS